MEECDEAEQDKELKEALEEIIKKTEEMERRIDEILRKGVRRPTSGGGSGPT